MGNEEEGRSWYLCCVFLHWLLMQVMNIYIVSRYVVNDMMVTKLFNYNKIPQKLG